MKYRTIKILNFLIGLILVASVITGIDYVIKASEIEIFAAISKFVEKGPAAISKFIEEGLGNEINQSVGGEPEEPRKKFVDSKEIQIEYISMGFSEEMRQKLQQIESIFQQNFGKEEE